MVVVSVLTLALSSLTSFHRNLTLCEVGELLGHKVELLEPTPEDCTRPLDDQDFGKIIVDYQKINVTNQTELAHNDVILDDDKSTTASTASTTTTGSQRGVNVTKVRGLFDFNRNTDTVSDEELLDTVVEALRPSVGMERKTVRIQILVYLDTACLAFFTVDLLLRILCCPNVKRYFLSAINVMDALAVFSAYALILVNLLRTDEAYTFSNFDILELVQVLRVVRLLRIVRDVMGFKVLSFSLRVSAKDLFVLFLYIILGVVIFANFVYFVESESSIESIPEGWWWAISTLTTVGYGDVVPVTLYGRLIGGLCAISGVIIMAVAIPVFVRTFLLLYAYAVLYKKFLIKPEDTHRYIHRMGQRPFVHAHVNGKV